MAFKDKKILITGANGFVGSRLVERLYLEYDANITALVRNMGRSSRIGRMRINIERGDILDKELVERLTREADIIVHLATGGKRGIINGTRIIARYARKYGVERFVHMSSAAVYGIKPCEEHITEEAPLKKTGNVYADGKIKAEDIINRETKKGLQSVILRPRVIWGPYSFWVTNYYKQVKNNNFYLIDGGEGACNTIFIDNLIDAIILSIKNKKAIGEIFFVTDDEEITWRRYYETFAKFLKREIRFKSISSRDYYESKKNQNIFREIRSFIGSNIMQDFLLNAPLINRMTKPIFDMIFQMPEERKDLIKDIIKYNRPERNLKPREELPPTIDELRIERESGKGFTSIEKIKNTLGYKPNIDFSTGCEITREWLKFAGILDA